MWKKSLYLLSAAVLSLSPATVCYSQTRADAEPDDSLQRQARAALYTSESAEDPYLPKVIPPTPQSMVYQNYLNHQTNEASGIPDINIPLYELEVKGMKIPITLSYYASGVKAHQYDGDIGAGWSINVGGYKVMRSVYGQEDERFPHYSSATWLSQYANIDGSSSAQMRMIKDYYLQDVTKIQDGEYDRFSYLLPSSSGSFIIQNGNKSNQVSALIAGPQRDKIAFTNGNATYSFQDITITDAQGTVYQLGGDSQREYSVGHPIPPAVGWPLLKITTPHKENITFEYKKYITLFNEPLSAGAIYAEAPFYTNIVFRPGGLETHLNGGEFASPYTPSGYLMFDRQSNSSSLIDKITTPYCKVVFVRRDIPTDGMTEDQRYYSWNQLITAIEIYNNKNELIRKFAFTYDLAAKSGPCKHNLLKSMIISAQQSSSQEKYLFSYYEPRTEIKVPNQWGYGGSGSYLHANLENYPQLLWKKSVYPGTPSTYRNLDWLLLSPEILSFGDRSKPTTEEYSLKRITFPTGGFTEYKYEQHLDDQNKTVGGLRVKEIASKHSETATPVITKFEYADALFEVMLPYTDFVDETYELGFMDNPPAYIDRVEMFRCSRTLLFSTLPIPGDLLSYKPQYGRITALQYDPINNKYNGKTISVYSKTPSYPGRDMPQRAYITPFIGDEADMLEMPTDANIWGRGFWVDTYIGYSPVLLSRSYYDSHNNIKKQENYVYSDIQKGIFQELRAKEKIRVNNAKTGLNMLNVYKYISTQFDYMDYDLRIGFRQLNSKQTIEYTDSGETTHNETYTYNQNHQLVQKISGNLSETYSYPEDFTDMVYVNMVTANILSPVIEKVKYNQIFSLVETGRVKTNYANRNGIYLPASIQSKGLNANYRTEISFDRYDAKGNIIEYTTLDGVTTLYLWSYRGQYPIAEIKNATYSQLTAIISQTDLDAISASIEPSTADMRRIDNLRTNSTLANALITTYTYQPLVGVRTVTDPAGVVTSYEYDSLGRLTKVKDHDGSTLEDYEYHYQTH